MKWCLLIVLLLLVLGSYAQSENNFTRSPVSVYFQAGGQQVMGIHINGYVSPRFSINGELGLGLSAAVGTNYYWMKRSEFGVHFFGGLRIAALSELNVLGDGGLASGQYVPGVYLPVGLEWKHRKGFTLQFNLGPHWSRELYQINTRPFLVALNLGYTPKRQNEEL